MTADNLDDDYHDDDYNNSDFVNIYHDEFNDDFDGSMIGPVQATRLYLPTTRPRIYISVCPSALALASGNSANYSMTKQPFQVAQR